MRLTKTQQYLLDQAKGRAVCAIDVIGGRGAFGGRVSAGNRERTALNKLSDLGLVQITNQMTSTDYNRGNCVWTTTICYRLNREATA